MNLVTRAYVRETGNDAAALFSHPPNMERRRAPRSIEALEDLRRTSGWYLAAWREYRGLSQTDVALEAKTTKGAVSELETGKPRKDGSIPRFNRDTLEKMSQALDVAGGLLIDVNPFTANPDWLRVQDKMRGLDADGRAMAVRLVEAIESPAKVAGK